MCKFQVPSSGDTYLIRVSPSKIRYCVPGTLKIGRDWQCYRYTGASGSDPDDPQQEFSAKIPPANDTSFDEYQDTVPTNSSGWIYDLDAPRLSRYGDSVGEIQRMRANPKTFVQVTVPESSDPVRASGVTPFYVRISIQQQDVLSGTNWTLVNDVSNDNGAGYETKPVTWNLQ